MLQKLNDERLRSAVAGGLGGLLSWFLIEPLVAPRLEGVTDIAQLYPIDALFGALAGVCIGATLGVAEGVVTRSGYRAARGALIGALAGIIGGAIGLVIGEMVFQPLKLLCFIGRSIGWAVFGAFLGVAEGVTRRSLQGMRSAALGGLIGGAIGGFAFDLVGVFTLLISPSSGLSRGVALTILGACIGLWIVVMERRRSPALLKVVSGQFEGREFFLDKPRVTLGSDERGDVALFGDPEISRQHATLTYAQKGYVIEAQGGAAVAVNGQGVQRQSLLNDDELLIGRTKLIYRDRVRAATRAVSEPAPVTPAISAPAPPPAPPSSGPWLAAPSGPAAGGGPMWLADSQTGQRYSLRPDVTTLGRAPDNDIVLEGATVSGRHAEIRCESGRYILYDMNSRNGTFVNGRRVAGMNLVKPGWRIAIGEFELQMTDGVTNG